MTNDLKVETLDDEMLTKEDLIKMLKVSSSMVGKLMKETNIPRYHLGRRVLFRKSEVLEWMKRYRSTGQEE